MAIIIAIMAIGIAMIAIIIAIIIARMAILRAIVLWPVLVAISMAMYGH